jgi:hypothetical protein
MSRCPWWWILAHATRRIGARVTRLGEFSPIRFLFTLRSFFENYLSSANLWTPFSKCISHVFILPKNCLGCILGDFFTNSSGHPDWCARARAMKYRPRRRSPISTVDRRRGQCELPNFFRAIFFYSEFFSFPTFDVREKKMVSQGSRRSSSRRFSFLKFVSFKFSKLIFHQSFLLYTYVKVVHPDYLLCKI